MRVLRAPDRVLIVEQRLVPPRPLTSLPEPWRRGQTIQTSHGSVLADANWLLVIQAEEAIQKVRFERP